MNMSMYRIKIVPSDPMEFTDAEIALSDYQEFTLQKHGHPDLYLIHFDRFSPEKYLQKSLQYPPPVIVYGKAESMRYAFSLGCKDFIRYPFEADELAARLLRALPQIINKPEEFRLALEGKILKGESGWVKLTNTERSLLMVLAAHAPGTVTRDLLFSTLFEGVSRDSRYPDITAGYLRKKIRQIVSSEVAAITSVRGEGYCL